jgi:hypothetical protein
MLSNTDTPYLKRLSSNTTPYSVEHYCFIGRNTKLLVD